METQCPDCGTENYEGSRFCRKCGRTLIDFGVSEATTRSLDERERAARLYAEAGDRPQYVPPKDATPPGGLAPQTGFQPAAGTNPLAQKAPLWPIWIALAVALVVLMAVGATFFVHRNKQRASAAAPSAAPAIAPPAEGEATDEDAEADVAVDPEAVEEDPDSLLPQVPANAKKWVYPGSTVESINQPPGGGQVILEMTSDDSLARVSKFYSDKLPNAHKSIDRRETAIVGGEAIATIEDNGDGVQITVVVHSGGGGPGFIPNIPPIVIPTPPAPPPPPPAPKSR